MSDGKFKNRGQARCSRISRRRGDALFLLTGFMSGAGKAIEKSRSVEWIHLKREPFAFAGAGDSWLDRDTGSELDTFTIITNEASTLARRIHNRCL
jgi:putative SOS response-associated peptidase YedK